MTKLVEWFNGAENKFFAVHLVSVFVLAIILELAAPSWTTVTYPGLILLASASFLWNYPVKAIQNHGLFSEYLIESRLLWLVISGLLLEYVVFGVFEKGLNATLAAGALIAGLTVALIARNRLQERLVETRGFK